VAVVRIPQENQTVEQPEQVRNYLATVGIEYERWHSGGKLPPNASAEEILNAYGEQIDQLKARGGYVTADVIDVNPETPNLDAMLAKFSIEHWHDEDEVRYIVAGRGLFHIHPKSGPVIAIEVEARDLIRVPRGTLHWFDLCGEKRIRAIRLFQDTSGWTPHYTHSTVDKNYEPVCLGPRYISPQTVAK